MTVTEANLLAGIRESVVDYFHLHGCFPHRLWLSQEAALLLIDELMEKPELYEIPVEVTKMLKGIAYLTKSADKTGLRTLLAWKAQ